MNQTIKDKIARLNTTQLAKAIGHYTQYTLLSGGQKMQLVLQFGMDQGWQNKAETMIDYVREVYEEKIKC